MLLRTPSIKKLLKLSGDLCSPANYKSLEIFYTLFKNCKEIKVLIYLQFLNNNEF
jgi:hypothetical protein